LQWKLLDASVFESHHLHDSIRLELLHLEFLDLAGLGVRLRGEGVQAAEVDDGLS